MDAHCQKKKTFDWVKPLTIDVVIWKHSPPLDHLVVNLCPYQQSPSVDVSFFFFFSSLNLLLMRRTFKFYEKSVLRSNAAGCFSPFFSQILEKSLRILFETRDLSLVKKFVQRQCTKLMEGRASLQDFTFAKEYRGMKNYKPGACVPALELTRWGREETEKNIN